MRTHTRTHAHTHTDTHNNTTHTQRNTHTHTHTTHTHNTTHTTHTCTHTHTHTRTQHTPTHTHTQHNTTHTHTQHNAHTHTHTHTLTHLAVAEICVLWNQHNRKNTVYMRLRYSYSQVTNSRFEAQRRSGLYLICTFLMAAGQTLPNNYLHDINAKYTNSNCTNVQAATAYEL